MKRDFLIRLSRRWLAIGLASCALGMLGPVSAFAQADPMLTEKRVFTLPAYTTVGGGAIKQVRVGYESWGKLNADGSNVVFIAHFYSGTSHAAGRYKPTDTAPGYWDAIIGPGKAIDTNKYFVISADTLANLNTKDPNVTTTGPSSVNPDTGKPYGMSFPVVTMGDSVRVHKALLDSLGVKKLHAVVGASGGSIQAMEWAAMYPDFVERVIHVIGPGFSISPWAIGLLEAWVAPIKQDPKWRGGDYYGHPEPVNGVAEALKLVTLTAGHWGWAEKSFGYKPAAADKAPGAAVDNRFLIEDVLVKAGMARASNTDANNKIYMAKANQLFNVEAAVERMKSRILFMPASSDLIFPPEFSRKAFERYRALGKPAEYFELKGDRGHLEGVVSIAQAADAIRAFLDK